MTLPIAKILPEEEIFAASTLPLAVNVTPVTLLFEFRLAASTLPLAVTVIVATDVLAMMLLDTKLPVNEILPFILPSNTMSPVMLAFDAVKSLIRRLA